MKKEKILDLMTLTRQERLKRLELFDEKLIGNIVHGIASGPEQYQFFNLYRMTIVAYEEIIMSLLYPKSHLMEDEEINGHT